MRFDSRCSLLDVFRVSGIEIQVSIDEPVVMDKINENISQQVVQTALFRGRVETLRDRLSLLGEKDRLLMTMYLENGNSFRQIAKLTGANEVNISRKVRRIISRLLDARFIICLRNRKKMSAFELSVARDYFVRGLSLKVISQKKSVSYHAVRKSMKNVKRILEVESHRPQGAQQLKQQGEGT